MARRERKYLLPVSKLAAVRALILPHVELDPYTATRPGNEYTVRSLYLDTTSLDFYQEKLAGLRERMKVRIRGYNDISPTMPVFLEIKRKRGSTVIKQRSRLEYRNLALFLESSDVDRCISPSPREEQLRENARQFLFHLHARMLRPTITITYEREAFYSTHDRSLRITLDKNLRWHNDVAGFSLSGGMSDLPSLPGQCILEIKSETDLPLWTRLILSRLDIHTEALSKYTICVDSLKAGCLYRNRTDPEDMRLRRALLES